MKVVIPLQESGKACRLPKDLNLAIKVTLRKLIYWPKQIMCLLIVS